MLSVAAGHDRSIESNVELEPVGVPGVDGANESVTWLYANSPRDCQVVALLICVTAPVGLVPPGPPGRGGRR